MKSHRQFLFCNSPMDHYKIENNQFFDFCLTNEITSKVISTWMFISISISTFFAVLFWIIEKKFYFFQYLILSSSQGISVIIFILLTLHFTKNIPSATRSFMIFLFGNIGLFAGISFGTYTTGIELSRDHFFNLVRLDNCVGFVIFTPILYWQWNFQKRKSQYIKTINVIKNRKEIDEKHLKLIQAHIEPAFLNDTLVQIMETVNTDPKKGKSLYLYFIQYLRSFIFKATDESSSFTQNNQMLLAYFTIIQIQLRGKVDFQFDFPKILNEVPLSPMLIQKFIESILQLREEKNISDGTLSVKMEEHGELLRIIFTDTGLSFAEDIWKKNTEAIIFLRNFLTQLKSLYGDNSIFTIHNNQFQHMEAIIEIPRLVIPPADQSFEKPV